jgi:HSP20 family molecular chaperone IbpA
MSDIFISYTREDLDRVEPIVRLLEQRQWSVWWDLNIPPGKAFDEVIENELESARCVIVVWSKTSVQSRWVKNEASEGAGRNILIPVIVDDGIKIPLEFRKIQATTLSGWDGKSAHSELNKLLNAVAVTLDENPWAPPVDVMAEEGHYIVVMDLPGLVPDEVEVTIESSFLIVSGILRVTLYGNPDKFIIAERKGRKFYRKIPFPEDLNGISLTSDYRDGVLILDLIIPST